MKHTNESVAALSDIECEACNGTGFYGDLGPGGARSNNEYVPCECKTNRIN